MKTITITQLLHFVLQEYTRAALIACFHLKISYAIEILGLGAERVRNKMKRIIWNKEENRFKNHTFSVPGLESSDGGTCFVRI